MPRPRRKHLAAHHLFSGECSGLRLGLGLGLGSGRRVGLGLDLGLGLGLDVRRITGEDAAVERVGEGRDPRLLGLGLGLGIGLGLG